MLLLILCLVTCPKLLWECLLQWLFRNSCGDSWDSSCEKSKVLLLNHWFSVQKTSSKLKKLGSLCNQEVTESKDRLQNPFHSLLLNIKIYSFYLNNQNKGTKINYALLKHPQKSHKQDFVQKRLQLDRSLHPSGCIH